MTGRQLRLTLPILLAGCLATMTGCATFEIPKFGAFGADNGKKESQIAFGRLCERRGNLDEAEEIYNAMLKRSPRDADLHHRMGVVMARQGRFGEAEPHFQSALKANSSNVELLNDYGYHCYLQDKAPEAESMFRKVLAQNPRHTSALNNLGLLLGQQGKYDEAFGNFKQAGSEAEAYANVGYCRALQNDVDNASRDYSKALTLNPKLRTAAEAAASLATQSNKRAQLMNQQIAQRNQQLQQPGGQPMPAGAQPPMAGAPQMAQQMPMPGPQQTAAPRSQMAASANPAVAQQPMPMPAGNPTELAADNQPSANRREAPAEQVAQAELPPEVSVVDRQQPINAMPLGLRNNEPTLDAASMIEVSEGRRMDRPRVDSRRTATRSESVHAAPQMASQEPKRPAIVIEAGPAPGDFMAMAESSDKSPAAKPLPLSSQSPNFTMPVASGMPENFRYPVTNYGPETRVAVQAGPASPFVPEQNNRPLAAQGSTDLFGDLSQAVGSRGAIPAPAVQHVSTQQDDGSKVVQAVANMPAQVGRDSGVQQAYAVTEDQGSKPAVAPPVSMMPPVTAPVNMPGANPEPRKLPFGNLFSR